MVTKKRSFGDRGEEAAAQYLISRGYRIVERNYQTKFGEIDIVAQGPRGIFVFVEVKTMRVPEEAAQRIVPEDQMTSAKMRKFERIAEFYFNKNTRRLGEGRTARLDLVTVIFRGEDESPTIAHYEGI